MPTEVMEIQVEELSEIKTSKPTEKSPQGAKYFVVNRGQFICFKTDLHPVFTALQGKPIKCNIYPGTGDKSARIDSLHLTETGELPHKEAKPPPDAPQAATVIPERGTPLPKTGTRDELIEKQVAMKELGECYRTGTLEYPALKQMYFEWLEKVTGAAHQETWEAKWIGKLKDLEPEMREKIYVNLPKIIEKLTTK